MHFNSATRLNLGLSICLFVSFAAGAGAQVSSGSQGRTQGKTQDWPYYGGPGQTRYSPLKQITRENVNQLQVAWSYDPGEAGGPTETQPIMVKGVVYGLTASHKIIALDAAAGKLLWKADVGLESRGTKRGLVYWTDGKEERLFLGVQNYLCAVDARTGKPVTSFGNAGRVDLREGLGRDPKTVVIGLNTPGVIYKDLLIVGSNMGESRPSPPGDVRAYDVRTGKMRWSFHTIPHPGEFGYDTWPKDAWTYSGSANNWAGMSVDQRRGLVFVPTGSASTDFYGFDRHGDNLFANSVIALKADSGQRVWHFQGVKHDIWDRDFDSPPTLVTVKRDGKMVEAVAQTSKQGWLYLFDRASGKPLFPIEYRSYPPSTVPGEKTAETQGLPTKPAAFARQRLTEDLLTNRTPEAHKWALDQFRTLRSEGQFLPFAAGQNTVIMPGFDGGAEWGGSAFDPETGIIYVNANDIAWVTSLVKNEGGTGGRQYYLTNCAACHNDDMTGAPPAIPSLVAYRAGHGVPDVDQMIRQGSGRMPGFPNLTASERAVLAQYVITGKEDAPDSRPTQLNPLGMFNVNGAGMSEVSTPNLIPYRMTGYNKFLDPDGYPAVAPPWGTLNAIDLNTGEYAWKIPLGEYPELTAIGVKDTGTENYGGPVVTAGGLVFIGATVFDRKFRAFDKATGKLLWETELPQSGNSTPITYEVGGRQYVVIHATGLGRRGGDRATSAPSGGVYVAFALPAAGDKK